MNYIKKTLVVAVFIASIFALFGPYYRANADIRFSTMPPEGYARAEVKFSDELIKLTNQYESVMYKGARSVWCADKTCEETKSEGNLCVKSFDEDNPRNCFITRSDEHPYNKIFITLTDGRNLESNIFKTTQYANRIRLFSRKSPVIMLSLKDGQLVAKNLRSLF